MKQTAAFALAILAIFALIVAFGGAPVVHRGGIAFVVMGSGAPRVAGCGSIEERQDHPGVDNCSPSQPPTTPQPCAQSAAGGRRAADGLTPRPGCSPLPTR
jgi:hypothetical protein